MTFTSEFTLQPERKFPGASLQHTDTTGNFLRC